MTKKSTLKILIIVLLCSYSSARAQYNLDKDTQCIRAMHSITAAECFEHVSFLAGDVCSGRGTCDEGFNKAAAYVARNFKESGLLTLMKDSSYYQVFRLDRNKICDGNEFSLEILISSPSGKDTLNIPYKIEEDFLPAGVSSPCDIKANIVFAGYGITSIENDWDDYKNINVKNKVVMVLGGTPPLEGKDFGQSYRVSVKADYAENAGAAALIVVGKPIGTISNCQSIPVLTVSEKVADDILKGTAESISGLKEKIKDKKKALSLKLKNPVLMKINAKLINDCKTMNVVSYIEGSDSLLRNEFIVIGAHVDHLGTIDGHVFYGANDNASGSAVVMEIAEAFSMLKEKPKRSVLFIVFTGEEMGLLGSSWFVQHSPVPLSHIKAMVNLDMVGSGDDAVMVVGGNTFPEFAQLFDTIAGQYIHLPIKRRWTSANSDHYPFHHAGIPSVFLYAMRGVPTYHSSADKPETLDPEVMESVGRLVFLTTYELANAEKIEFSFVDQGK